MPTGYTGKLYSGEPQTFEEFTLSCARAFGALVHMRDDPADAPIPERFEPGRYYAESLDRDRTALRDISKLSEAECFDRSRREYDDEIAARAKQKAEAAVLRKSYEAMLAKVKAWHPPTSEHAGLKDFMIQQLTESIKWDCDQSYYERNPPVLLSGADWKRQKVASLSKSIGLSAEEHELEVSRAAQRTRWVADLRKSLA